MNRFSIRLFLVALFVMMFFPAHADEVSVAAMLEGLGGKVIRKDGVVTEIEFRDSKGLGAEQWEQIGGLSNLKKITVYGGAAGLNDATVPQLLKLKNLESLSADGAQLSDSGLRTLAGCTSLRSVSFFHLSFRMEGFTGEGFAAWEAMPNLEKLTVAGMSMGDAGLAAIAKIKSLKELRTWHTAQSEAGNLMIATLPNLTSLMLGQRLPGGGKPPSLTDVSLQTIATIKTLESLEIGEAKFSLDGLRKLGTLPNLKKLKITKTEITDQDIATLQGELPGMKVEFVPITVDERKKLEMYLK